MFAPAESLVESPEEAPERVVMQARAEVPWSGAPEPTPPITPFITPRPLKLPGILGAEELAADLAATEEEEAAAQELSADLEMTQEAPRSGWGAKELSADLEVTQEAPAQESKVTPD